MPKNTAAIASIRALCSLGLTGELLIPALLEALHQVIPSARNLFDWVDSEGRIVRYFFEGPIDHQIAARYFDEFHNRREAEAMPKYRDVIRGSATVRSAEELNTHAFFDSALYHEIWRPQRLHCRLEGIVRSGQGKPLGSLVLYRERGEKIFDRADEELFARLLPYIARGLAEGARQGVHHVRGEPREALVNLDASGRIVHLSRNAHKVLLLAHGDISPDSAARPPCSEAFPTLGLLHRQVTRTGRHRDAACTLTLTNPWGRFDFSAEPLQPMAGADAPLIGVSIQHLLPAEVQRLGRLSRSGLSVAQQRVCSLLLEGLPQAAIAARLNVSKSTVVDHIRKIYLHLGCIRPTGCVHGWERRPLPAP
jgi:DNA-binding CsgD family transcriptional regulator